MRMQFHGGSFACGIFFVWCATGYLSWWWMLLGIACLCNFNPALATLWNWVKKP